MLIELGLRLGAGWLDVVVGGVLCARSIFLAAEGGDACGVRAALVLPEQLRQHQTECRDAESQTGPWQGYNAGSKRVASMSLRFFIFKI